jgi:hypothetical protein
VKLGPEPASGLVPVANGDFWAFGQPSGIHFYFGGCPAGHQQRVQPVTGTPHVDDVGSAPQAVYTLDDTVYYDGEALGRGHGARNLGNTVFWINDGQVLMATANTPSGPAGETGPDLCEGTTSSR